MSFFNSSHNFDSRYFLTFKNFVPFPFLYGCMQYKKRKEKKKTIIRIYHLKLSNDKHTTGVYEQ